MHESHAYDVAFVITCVDEKHIRTCLDSIRKSNSDLRCAVLLLVQNGMKIDCAGQQDVFLSEIPNIVPLSKARNILLRKHEHIDTQYFMFPDDDSSFDGTFFKDFKSQVASNTLIEVRTAEDKSEYFLRLPARTFARRSDYDKAISVNMVISRETMRQVGLFDENLGTGCYYGAGEDNDFFLRCTKFGAFRFCSGLYNMHPAQRALDRQLPVDVLIKRYESYGRGVVYALCKNGLRGQALKVCLRGFLGGVKSLMTLRPRMARVYFAAAIERVKTLFRQ